LRNSLPVKILVFTLIRIVLGTMHRMVYPFMREFSRGLGVDTQALTLAVTARSAIGGAGPFLASIADSRSRKTGMLLGLLLFATGAGLVVVWPSYPALFAALALAMLGNSLFEPSVQAYLGDRVPYEQRGRVLAIVELGWSLSFIIGMPAMSILIARSGWNAPFKALAVIGLVALIFLGWFLADDANQPSRGSNLYRNFRLVLTSRAAVTGIVMEILFTSGNEVVNLVFGLWLEDSFALKITALGAASAVIGLAELNGELLTAFIIDRLGKARAIAIGLSLNSLIAVGLPIVGRSLPGALTGLFLFYLTFEFVVVSSIPLLSEILPEGRATMMSFTSTGRALGRALSALLAAPLYAIGIQASSLAALAFNVAALAALQFVSRELQKDRQPTL
jgi:predicted MFS family arabinose efflux permease